MKLLFYYRIEYIIGLYIIDFDKIIICRESVLIIIFFKCKCLMCMDLMIYMKYVFVCYKYLDLYFFWRFF